MTIYTKKDNGFGTDIIVRDNENGTISFIPMDEANSDYQAYLAANSGSSVPDDPLATADSVSPSSIVP